MQKSHELELGVAELEEKCLQHDEELSHAEREASQQQDKLVTLTAQIEEVQL